MLLGCPTITFGSSLLLDDLTSLGHLRVGGMGLVIKMALFIVLFILFIILFILFIVIFILFIVLFILFIVIFILFIVLFILFIVRWHDLPGYR